MTVHFVHDNRIAHKLANKAAREATSVTIQELKFLIDN